MSERRLKLVAVILLLIGLVVWVKWFAPYDDTDPPGERSGLVLYIDHLTGCQYVKAGSIFGGSLTPRIDRQGNPICKESL